MKTQSRGTPPYRSRSSSAMASASPSLARSSVTRGSILTDAPRIREPLKWTNRVAKPRFSSPERGERLGDRSVSARRRRWPGDGSGVGASAVSRAGSGLICHSSDTWILDSRRQVPFPPGCLLLISESPYSRWNRPRTPIARLARLGIVLPQSARRHKRRRDWGCV